MDALVFAPSERQLALLEWVILFLTALHLGYVGALTGTLACALRPGGKAATPARDALARLFTAPALVALGLVPPLCLSFAFAQTLYRSGSAVPLETARETLVLAAAFAALAPYARSLAADAPRRSAAGAAACALLAAYCALFTGSLHSLSFFGVAGEGALKAASTALHILAFFSLSGALAGAAMLVTPSSAAATAKSDDAQSAALRTIALGLPAFLLFGLAAHLALPAEARALDAVGPWSLVLLLALAIAVMLYRSDLGFDQPLAACVLLVLVTNAVSDGAVRTQALRPHTKALVLHARQERAKRAGEAAPRSLVEGSEVFRRHCAGCHAWSRTITGPPFQEVLPRWEGRADALTGFVRSPSRVNPAYPPMPRPSLDEDELEAVVAYLLGDYLKSNRRKE